MHGAGLCSLHFTLTNPSSLDINENNRAYSETDDPSPIFCQALFTISAFCLVFIFQFLLDRVPPFHWITKKVNWDCWRSSIYYVLVSYTTHTITGTDAQMLMQRLLRYCEVTIAIMIECIHGRYQSQTYPVSFNWKPLTSPSISQDKLFSVAIWFLFCT